MAGIKYKKLPNGRVFIEIRDLRTECPFSSKGDISDIIITCKKSSLDYEEFAEYLSHYIDENIKGKEIEMEVIPIEVLKGYVTECIKLRIEEGRYAAPEEVEVECISRKEDGKWGIFTKVKFDRKVLDKRGLNVY